MNSSFQMTPQKLAQRVHKMALLVINGYEEWYGIIVSYD